MSHPLVYCGIASLLALSLLSLGVSLWKALSRKKHPTVQSWLVGLVAVITSCCVLLMTLQWFHLSLIQFGILPVAMALFSGVVIHLGGEYYRSRQAKPLSMVLAAVSILSVGNYAQTIQQLSNRDIVSIDRTIIPGELQRVKVVAGMTDQGRRVDLMQWRFEPGAFESYIEGNRKSFQELAENAIVRDEPDERSNCHGWIFADGKYVVPSEQVDQILLDNGYKEVSKPAINDVVVFRDTKGRVLHSAIVRGVLVDGEVMVESKWGIEGSYLHTVSKQPYSQNFHFYRSDRLTHTLKIVDPTAFRSNRPRVAHDLASQD